MHNKLLSSLLKHHHQPRTAGLFLHTTAWMQEVEQRRTIPWWNQWGRVWNGDRAAVEIAESGACAVTASPVIIPLNLKTQMSYNRDYVIAGKF